MIITLLDTIRLLFHREKEPFLRLKKILGFYPHNINLYRLALKHKSVVKGKHLNNERLEFLGDAILGAIVADILYKHYGNKQEGFLTQLRSKIVCRKSLNELAVKIGLDKLILHNAIGSSSHNSYMNGNAFEAFFGAIYLDRGYSYCYKFMEEQIFKTYINVDSLASKQENYKSSLIEWCQKYQFAYQFVQKEIREGNNPKFISTVSIEGLSCGNGEGYSKKESDQNAAKSAYQTIKKQKSLVFDIRKAREEKNKKARIQSRHDKAINAIKGRKTLIFDLDGTLLDTLQDLANSTNYALQQCNYPERPVDEIKTFVGNGISKLIERAVPEKTDEQDFNKCLSFFKEHYVEHCQDCTKPYPGIEEMLHKLKAKGFKIAIVSNKLQAGVDELQNSYFKDYADVAIGERPDVKRKPEPDMVNIAIAELDSCSDDSIYIGDSEVDIATAHNANIPCISVLWGFRDQDFLYENGASLTVEQPSDIVDLLH